MTSVRGAYYGAKRTLESGGAVPRRTKRRETTAEDAVAGAVASLERAIEDIERELEAMAARALA